MESSNPSEKKVMLWKAKQQKIEEIISTLPQNNAWKLGQPLCLYQGHWYSPCSLEGTIFAQQNFKPQPGDIFICSVPKTGTTWLKALAFAIVTRTHFHISHNPLLTKVPHDCIRNLELNLIKNYIPTAMRDDEPNLPLWSTHIPYSHMPKSITDDSGCCRIVYIWRDPKDTFVALWHFLNKINSNSCHENVSLDEAFELFCKGISLFGPYWDHVFGYRKASLERPEKVLLLKYEEMMEDTALHLKRLAKFIGHPFSLEEENDGVVQKIIELCSFDNLSNFEVNKSGKYFLFDEILINNDVFFRKGKVGDWRNYLSFEMGQRLDEIMEEKLSDSGFK